MYTSEKRIARNTSDSEYRVWKTLSSSIPLVTFEWLSARMDDIIQGQEPQGLFSKRSSSNILSDPRILAHLRIVAEEAQSSDKEQDEESELQNTKRELGLKIAAYNKGNQHGAFRLILKEVRECFITKYIVEGMHALIYHMLIITSACTVARAALGNCHLKSS